MMPGGDTIYCTMATYALVEVPHDAMAVCSNLEEQLYFNTRDIFLVRKRKVFSCLCKIFSGCRKMCTIQDLSGLPKYSQLISKMTKTMGNWLRTNYKVTASKLKANLLELCTNFADVDLQYQQQFKG